MDYTAPAGNNVQFDLTETYTEPAGNNVIFEMVPPDEGTTQFPIVFVCT